MNIKYFGVLFLALLPITQAFSQNIIVVQTRRVEPGDMGEYVHRENTYWKEVAKKAISEDRLTGWSIWQRIGGFNVHEDYNILVVNTYTPEQFAKAENIWDYRKVFPDAKREDVITSGISTTQDVLFLRSLAYIENTPPKVIRVNYADAKNVGEYARMEPEIWGTFIDKQMKAGTTKVVSWGFSVLVNPSGRDAPYDAVSVDGFNSLADALGQNFNDDVVFPEGIEELMESHDKVNRELFRIVASIDDE